MCFIISAFKVLWIGMDNLKLRDWDYLVHFATYSENVFVEDFHLYSVDTMI